MRVLVTGASGFLGKSVIQHLVNRGFDVVGIHNSRKAELLQTHPNVAWIRCDLLAHDDLDEFVASKKCQGLIHLAWTTTHRDFWTSNKNLEWLGASTKLFEAFRKAGGKRIMAAGSSAEYLWGDHGKLNEYSSELNPTSLYGISKNALRQVLSKWATQNDISWCWVRLFNIYGAGESPNKLISNSILRLARGEQLSFDSCEEERDFMHVKDAGSAIASLFQSETFGAVNVASGNAIKVRFLLESIAETLGRQSQIKFDKVSQRGTSPKSVVACVNRLREESDWTPTISLQDGIKTTVEQLMSAGFTPESH